MAWLDKALEKGEAKLEGEEGKQRIIYVKANLSERYSDPEEQVRAEFWAELIYRYGYPSERIGIEVTVPDRRPVDRADLVVFWDDEHTKPYSVIECKREGITDAEFNQAIEQVCGNGTWAKFRADYVGVVAGLTRRFLDFSPKYGVLEREANIVADLRPQYGKPLEFQFYKGGVDREGNPATDIHSVSKEKLIAAIKKCHQTLWGGGRLSPPSAFGELCKIIFVKIRDEKVPRKKGEPYQFQIKTNEPYQMLETRIHELYSEAQKKDPDVFKESITIEPATLRLVVEHLQAIDLSGTDLDTKGIAFEQFMDGFFKGDFGQYFTPREVIAFAVEMMKPDREELVLDPACGSGGFLLYALDKIRSQADEYAEEGTAEHRDYWHDFAQNRLYGLDINWEIARVAKMNMIVHDDGHSNIAGADALQPIAEIKEKTNNKGFKKEGFNLILTNPPFGAQVRVEEHGEKYLKVYELGKDPKGKIRKSQKTEILFIERVHQFLQPGGRTAIVLPDGILTNSSLQYVRDFILEKFKLQAVVSLPQTAFSHYGAGVKSSLVFLKKPDKGEVLLDDDAVFMATAENIGYDATGRKTFEVIDTKYGVETSIQNGRQVKIETKVEIQRCDLYDQEVNFEKNPEPKDKKDEWREKYHRVIPDTGIVGKYREFEKTPEPFFA